MFSGGGWETGRKTIGCSRVPELFTVCMSKTACDAAAGQVRIGGVLKIVIEDASMGAQEEGAVRLAGRCVPTGGLK